MRLSSWLRSVRTLFEQPCTRVRTARPAKLAQPTRLSIIQLEDRTVPSTFSVLNLADSGAGSLRAAIAAANANPGEDEIDFAPSLKGTIVLTSGELGITDDVRIDGTGANRLAVSGNDASRVFKIGTGADVGIDGLTITHGRADRLGGGIWNLGTLTLSNAVVSDNEAVGLPGATSTVDAMGGGILNNGALAVSRSLFIGNRSTGGDGLPGGPGSTGLGGAIMSAGTGPGAPATATISDSAFVGNRAVGGTAGPGATFSRAGVGGALVNANATMTISRSLLRDNQAIGGAGGFSPGGAGVGGAIANVSLAGNSILSVSDSTLANNRAVGGFAPPGTSPQPGRGGGIANYTVAFAPVGSVTSTATITRSALVGNQAVGGEGPTGGDGLGGGILNENGATLSLSDSLLALNRAIGGEGDAGNGGNGLGGGIFNGPPNPLGAASVALNRDVVVLNQAEGGAGTGGSAGLGIGGGIYVAPGGSAGASLTVIFANDASTSDDNVFGILV